MGQLTRSQTSLEMTKMGQSVFDTIASEGRLSRGTLKRPLLSVRWTSGNGFRRNSN